MRSVSAGSHEQADIQWTELALALSHPQVKKGANRKLSSLAMAAMGGNQRGSVQISEPIIQVRAGTTSIAGDKGHGRLSQHTENQCESSRASKPEFTPAL